MKLEDLPAVLTAAEVAAIFRCSRETVRRKTEDGVFERIPGFHDLLYRRTHILELLGYRMPPQPEDDDVEAPPLRQLKPPRTRSRRVMNSSMPSANTKSRARA